MERSPGYQGDIVCRRNHCRLDIDVPSRVVFPMNRVSRELLMGTLSWSLQCLRLFSYSRSCTYFHSYFTHRAHLLTILTRKDYPFIFGPEQIAAQEDLKQAILNSPAIWTYPLHILWSSYTCCRYIAHRRRLPYSVNATHSIRRSNTSLDLVLSHWMTEKSILSTEARALRPLSSFGTMKMYLHQSS